MWDTELDDLMAFWSATETAARRSQGLDRWLLRVKSDLVLALLLWQFLAGRYGRRSPRVEASGSLHSRGCLVALVAPCLYEVLGEVGEVIARDLLDPPAQVRCHAAGKLVHRRWLAYYRAVLSSTGWLCRENTSQHQRATTKLGTASAHRREAGPLTSEVKHGNEVRRRRRIFRGRL